MITLAATSRGRGISWRVPVGDDRRSDDTAGAGRRLAGNVSRLWSPRRLRVPKGEGNPTTLDAVFVAICGSILITIS